MKIQTTSTDQILEEADRTWKENIITLQKLHSSYYDYHRKTEDLVKEQEKIFKEKSEDPLVRWLTK